MSSNPSGTCIHTRAARLRFNPIRLSSQNTPGVRRPQTYHRGMANNSATLHGSPGEYELAREEQPQAGPEDHGPQASWSLRPQAPPRGGLWYVLQ
jgi:hypothetical protein